MDEQQKSDEDKKVTLTLKQYENLVHLAAKDRPGILSEFRGILSDLHGWINYHMVYSALVTWEVIFYDKHAKDQTPDSIIELIQQLLTAAGNA